MMAYEQPEYQETSKEMRFAMAVFTAVAAGEVASHLFGLSGIAGWDWIILWRGLAVGLVAGGAAYAFALLVIAVAPGLPALLLREVEEATGKDLGGSDKPISEPMRERPKPHIEPLPLAESDLLPPWVLNTDRIVWGDRFNISGKLVDIPDGFDTDWLYQLAEMRYTGKLSEVSLRALDAVGISRFGHGTAPAAAVLEFLESAELVRSRGDRQPYDWTELGKRIFPCPTE